MPQQLDPNARRFTVHPAQPLRNSAMRICADRILQRCEFMSSGVWLTTHDYEQLSAELEDILLDLVAHTSLGRQELIDFVSEHCDMEKSITPA